MTFGYTKKSKKSRFLGIVAFFLHQIFRGARGQPRGVLCKSTGKYGDDFEVTGGSKNFSFWGADPHMGVGIPAWHGGISSAWGVLQYRVEISAKVSKMGEILRGKEKHLAPPSGQTESRRPATGHSTVAALEFYKPNKIGGRSSINGGDMVHFVFHENP